MTKDSKIFFIIIVVLALLSVAGIGAAYFIKWQEIKNINSFEECAAADYPILETYPEQCRLPDGRSFTKGTSDSGNITPPGGICVNKCGDGICQEIVCEATGCPCAETMLSCPYDCAETGIYPNE